LALSSARGERLAKKAAADDDSLAVGAGYPLTTPAKTRPGRIAIEH